LEPADRLAAEAASHLAAAGRAALAAGDAPAAGDLLGRAAAVLPDDGPGRPALRLALADALADTGDGERARALYREVAADRDVRAARHAELGALALARFRELAAPPALAAVAAADE